MSERDCWDRWADAKAAVREWLKEPGYFPSARIAADTEDLMRAAVECMDDLRNRAPNPNTET
jgi:hypothetical protein